LRTPTGTGAKGSTKECEWKQGVSAVRKNYQGEKDLFVGPHVGWRSTFMIVGSKTQLTRAGLLMEAGSVSDPDQKVESKISEQLFRVETRVLFEQRVAQIL